MSKLTIKQRQTYMKKLGLYTKKIDGKEGVGTKAGYEYLNIMLLNVSSNKYTDKTDSKLRVLYNSYCKSVYMTKDDWKLFPNFKESEFKCTCKGKYCNGYNGRYEKCYKKLIMSAQYFRNLFDKPLYISSGVRCKKRNKEVGGVNNSKHLVFKAMDVKIGTYKASQVFNKIKLFPLVAYTYEINNYYIHINV